MSEVKSNGNYKTINMEKLPGNHRQSLSRIMANEDETRTSSSVVGVITRRLQIQDALNLVHGGDAGLFPAKGASVESIEEDEMSYASELDDT